MRPQHLSHSLPRGYGPPAAGRVAPSPRNPVIVAYGPPLEQYKHARRRSLPGLVALSR